MHTLTPNRRPLLLAALALALVVVCGLQALIIGDVSPFAVCAASLAFGLKDVDPSVTQSKALPSSGGTSTSTDGIDVGNSSVGDFVAGCELLITAPALATGELPDGETITYKVEHDTDSAFGTVETLYDTVLVQTGAGGAGAAADTVRVRLPSDVKTHVRVTATSSATAGDCSGESVTAQLVF